MKFSQAVSKDAAAGSTVNGVTVDNLEKYTIGGDNPTEVTLSEDGKTATLVFAASIEGENKAVVVDPIVLAADDNKKTERYASTLTYKDAVKPEVTSVKATTGTDKVTSATLEFSEPISAVEAIKINGVALTAGTNYTVTSGATKLTLTGLDLEASKEHTVEIVNLADKAASNAGAANVTPYTSKTFTATVDKTAPTVTSVEPKNDNKLVVTFSKPVNLDTAVDASTIIGLVDADLTDNTTTLLPAGTKFTAVGTDKTKYEVALAATPFEGTAKTAKYTVKFLANTVTDLQGNKLAAATSEVTFTKDEAAPKLTNAAYHVDANGLVKELTFTFDEDVVFVSAPAAPAALTALLADSSVNVQNSVAGNLAAVFGAITGTFTVDKNVVKYELTTPLALSGKYDIKVDAGKLKDTSLSAATNTNKAADFTLDFGAPKEATTFKATNAVGTLNGNKENVITVTFAEAVKGGTEAGSAALATAYKLNGKALPEGAKITLNAAQTAATIVLPVATIDTTDASAIIIVDGITSKDGKKQLVQYTKTVSVTDNVAPELKAATLTADNKLVLTFSEKLATVPAVADLVVKINDLAVTTTPTPTVGTGSDLGKYTIDLSALVKQGTNAVTAVTAGWYVSTNATGTPDLASATPAAGDKFVDASDSKEYTYKEADATATPAVTAGWYLSTNITGTPDLASAVFTAGDKFVVALDSKEYTYKAAVSAVTGDPTYVDLDGSDDFDPACIMQDKNPSKCKLNFQHPSIIQFRDLY